MEAEVWVPVVAWAEVLAEVGVEDKEREKE
jgi:hypothetical protein